MLTLENRDLPHAFATARGHQQSCLGWLAAFALLLASATLAEDPAGEASILVVPQLLTGIENPRLDLSPDGRLLAVADGLNPTSLWDLEAQRLISSYEDALGQPRFLQSGLLAMFDETLGKLEFFDTETGEQRFHDDAYRAAYEQNAIAVADLALNADRSVLITVTVDERLQIWDQSTGLPVRTLGTPTEDDDEEIWPSPPRDIALSPDGRLAAVAHDSRVEVWDLIDGTKMDLQYEDAVWLSFTQDAGALLVHQHPPHSITAIDLSTQTAVWTTPLLDALHQPSDYDEARGDVRPVRQSQVGEFLLTSGPSSGTGPEGSCNGDFVCREGTLHLWSVGSGKLEKELPSFGAITRSVVASDDGSIVAAFDDLGGIVTWDMTTGRATRFLAESQPASMAVAADGRHILLGDQFGTVRRLDGETGELIPIAVAQVPASSVWSLSADGGEVAVGGDGGRIEVWNAEGARLRVFIPQDEDIEALGMDGTVVRTYDHYAPNTIESDTIEVGNYCQPYAFIGFPHVPCLLSVSSDGNLMVLFYRAVVENGEEAMIANDVRVTLVSTRTGDVVHVMNLTGGAPRAASFSPDASRLAVLTEGGSLEVFDVDLGELAFGAYIAEPPSEYDDTLVRFLDSSELLMTQFGTNKAVLWDLETGDGTDQPGWLTAVDAGHEGAIVYEAIFSDARVVDRSTGSVLTTFDDHLDLIHAIGALADGKRVATSSADGTTRIWDATTGEALLVLMTGGAPQDWVALTPAGFFNYGGDGLDLIAVRSDGISYGVEQFYDALYRPDLVQALLAGDPRLEYADAAEELNLRSILESGTLPQVTVTATTQQGNELRIVAEVAATNAGGIGDVAVSVRGESDERALQRAYLPGGRGELLGASGARCTTVPAETDCIVLDRTVPLESGRNTISIVAYNGANLLATDPVEIVWEAGEVTVPLGDLYVLALGVEDYAEGGVRGLSSAVDDAEAIAATLEEMRDPELYANVHVEVLRNAEVTRQNLEQVFTRLGDTIRPQDKFVFFVAGHGTTRAGRYYFFPQDFTYDDGGTIRDDAIDQDQWNLWFDRIKARASLFLYDTCEAGTVARNDDLAKEGALRRMITAMGRNVITASSAEQSAMESRDQGLFTRVLLEAFAAADYNGNDFVDITDLQLYVDDRVPVLSREWYGVAQDPTISIQANFPVGRLASLEVDDAPAAATVPAEPNGAILADTDLLDAEGNVIGSLARGTPVRVLETGELYRIARDGRELGFVPAGSVLEFALN